ncbi:discoidin domain-containing protein, partial [Traorella massiliensis]|uniref:discoidin domain-containing protein n=1 Tax=Traorella massiliensis TaxID=1903263 RepID=UPI00248E4FBE
DSETIVHIGADEYNASSEAYRKFVNDMIEYVRDTNERKVRVWGSFTAASKGEEIDTVADDGTRVQINLWNFGYANMDEMYENGFDLINCNDGNYYIVPNGGYYYDYLSDGTMYNLDINSIGGVTIPAGDKQMVGGAFAVWNDMTDYLDNGISEWDVYDRINNLPLFAAKLWGKEELNLNDANARADELGDAPRTNFNYEVDSETDEYMNLPMDELKDTSANEFKVSEGENASIVEADGKDALELKGSTSYITTGLETAGFGNSLRVKVKRTSTSTEEQILFESPYGSIKAVQKETGKVGFSRERFDYSFNYTLPLNEWVELEFKNVKNRISLYVNGELVDTIGDGEKVEGRPLLATMMFPMATIGSKTNAFIGYVDDVRIGKDTTFTSTMSLDYALWNASAILNDDNRDLLEPLIKEGKALLTQYAPEENEITRLSNEINKIVEAQDFEKADYTRVDIYKSLVEDLSAFTEESAKSVTRILDSIRYSLPVELQDTVDGYEYDLLKAMEGLETKPLTNLYYVDQSTMTATASSYQQDGSKPSNVLDGNPSTMWHTDWNITSMPHWIDLELSEPTEINGLVYTPRQSGTNGNATKYEIQVLVDGTYQTITSGTLKNDSTVKTIEFDPVTTTHIRLVYLEATNNNGSAAELQVVRANINADIEGLNTAIKDAEELLATLDKTDFTEATWTDVQNLLADAKALVSSSTPDANEVAQMIYDISKRVTQLRLEGNLTELNAAIDKAESLKESDYTATSWAFMQEKLAAAKEVAKNKNALQSTIDLAAAELNDAIDRLVKVDKTELQNKLNEAKAINTSEYTKESVAVLDKAMAEAEKVLTNANATQEEVDAAVKALEDAISGLQKPADPDTPTDPEKPTDPDTPADPEKPTDETPEEPETPTTSDNNMMVIYAGLLLLSAMVMVVLFKKRRQEH